MTLAPGSRLGPYEITAAIGAGGMGEVFRARDTKLNRDVAIKVLPAAFAQDHERVVRFKREAQVLASLNHPNIAGIYGLDESDGMVALVMELVEGEDLSQQLKRGAIPVDEAMGIAKQVAFGLEEAHERGIIHRDLKPANIKITPDGKVKILDFGLAKALDTDAAMNSGSNHLSHSPTMSRHGTEAGMIMGTAAYMSPEQGAGKVRRPARRHRRRWDGRGVPGPRYEAQSRRCNRPEAEVSLSPRPRTCRRSTKSPTNSGGTRPSSHAGLRVWHHKAAALAIDRQPLATIPLRRTLAMLTRDKDGYPF